jgi:uncharacterized SAM-binding protein YcdF (DUF218 family)
MMVYLIRIIYNTFLLPPSIFLIALFLLCVLLIRSGRRYAYPILAVTALFYLSSIPLVSGALIRSLEGRYSPPDSLSGDVIIMLCGGTTSDTPNTFGRGHLSGQAANRLLTSAVLQRRLMVPVIISGGKSDAEAGNESEIAARTLEGLGVAGEDIIIENKSKNTTQNALYTKAIVDSRDFRKPVLVTSAIHMARALRQFEKAGLPVTAYPTDYLTNRKFRLRLYLFLPKADSILGTQKALKEYLGLAAAAWY